MRLWNVDIPAKTVSVLKSLKTLALFEFLPTEKLTVKLKEWFKIDELGDFDKKEKETLWEKMIVFIMAGVAIIFTICLLVLLRACIKCSTKAQKLYTYLKNKLFYSTFIRYILLGTLKIQIEIGSAMAVGHYIPLTDQNEEASRPFMIQGAAIIGFLTLCPLIFLCVLARNRRNLAAVPVKTKISAMYFSLNPEKTSLISYSPVFLVRRSLFIVATFVLYQYPSMQVEVMLYTTLFYITFITQMSFYETTAMRRIEVMNECILVGICYHFVLFANPVW